MTQAQADLSDAWRGTDQGAQLKSSGISGLNFPYTGYLDDEGYFGGSITTHTGLWSSTASSAFVARSRNLASGQSGIYRATPLKVYGYSIRCLGN